MPKKEQYEALLVEAEAAKHTILTGKKPVRIEYQGRMVMYNNTEQSMKDLNNYIAELKINIRGRRCRAISVSF